MLGDDAIGVAGVESLTIKDGQENRRGGNGLAMTTTEPSGGTNNGGDAASAVPRSVPDLAEDAEV